MSRFSALRSSLQRHLQQQQRHVCPISTSSMSTLISTLRNTLPISPSQITPSFLAIPTAAAAASLASSRSTGFRSFSSDSDLPSNMVLVKSEEQLNNSLRTAADGSSLAVFYFTAVWCGPCRFIWPEIKKLSESLPNVKFYKIDIDEVGGGPTLSNLNICSVPTLHFFKNGKKADEVVGADAKRIKDVSSLLYRDDSAK